jgi:hypothetical protein
LAVSLAIPNYYGELAGGLATGLGRSIVFAFLVVWIAARLRRFGYLLKL